MKYAPIYKVMLVREGTIQHDVQVDSADKIADLSRPIFEGMDREQMVVLLFNAKYRFIGANVVSIGSLTASLVHPREVMKAIVLSNAAAFALVHNHPSGDPTPSPDDRDITDRIRALSELMGVKMLDHMILGDGKNFSFFQMGLLSL